MKITLIFPRDSNRFEFQMSDHVHTETFSCVFVLFQVMKLVVLDSLENSKQYKNAGNVSVCTGPQAMCTRCRFRSVFICFLTP